MLPPATQSGRSETAPVMRDAIQNMQDRKLSFLNAAVDRKTVRGGLRQATVRHIGHQIER